MAKMKKSVAEMKRKLAQQGRKIKTWKIERHKYEEVIEQSEEEFKGLLQKYKKCQF
jgi:hypothetical protein